MAEYNRLKSPKKHKKFDLLRLPPACPLPAPAMLFSFRSPCLLKREHWRKGERHARKGDKTLGNREKGTGLPDSGGRPH